MTKPSCFLILVAGPVIGAAMGLVIFTIFLFVSIDAPVQPERAEIKREILPEWDLCEIGPSPELVGERIRINGGHYRDAALRYQVVILIAFCAPLNHLGSKTYNSLYLEPRGRRSSYSFSPFSGVIGASELKKRESEVVVEGIVEAITEISGSSGLYKVELRDAVIISVRPRPAMN